VLEQFAAGTIHPLPQIESLVTRAPKLKKEMGAIDWTRPAAEIDCHIRAMQPWPKAFTFLHSPGKPPQRLLVLAVRPVPDVLPQKQPGAPVGVDREQLVVQAGDGAVEILQIQPEGKRPMSAADFRRGRLMIASDPKAPLVSFSRPAWGRASTRGASPAAKHNVQTAAPRFRQKGDCEYSMNSITAPSRDR
jgi:methionyl-tRNA formyltransferase